MKGLAQLSAALFFSQQLSALPQVEDEQDHKQQADQGHCHQGWAQAWPGLGLRCCRSQAVAPPADDQQRCQAKAEQVFGSVVG